MWPIRVSYSGARAKKRMRRAIGHALHRGIKSRQLGLMTKDEFMEWAHPRVLRLVHHGMKLQWVDGYETKF